MTPTKVSKKSNEKEVYSNLKDKREIQKPKFKLGQSVRRADIKRVFSKGDSTNWSYKLYTITEVTHNIIPSYRIDYLPERYDENLLLPTKLPLEQNNQVMKELNLIQKYNKYLMEITEDDIIQKYGKNCGHCNLNTLLLYEYELTCFTCVYNVNKRKHELSKIQRKK